MNKGSSAARKQPGKAWEFTWPEDWSQGSQAGEAKPAVPAGAGLALPSTGRAAGSAQLSGHGPVPAQRAKTPQQSTPRSHIPQPEPAPPSRQRLPQAPRQTGRSPAPAPAPAPENVLPFRQAQHSVPLRPRPSGSAAPVFSAPPAAPKAAAKSGLKAWEFAWPADWQAPPGRTSGSRQPAASHPAAPHVPLPAPAMPKTAVGTSVPSARQAAAGKMPPATSRAAPAPPAARPARQPEGKRTDGASSARQPNGQHVLDIGRVAARTTVPEEAECAGDRPGRDSAAASGALSGQRADAGCQTPEAVSVAETAPPPAVPGTTDHADAQALRGHETRAGAPAVVGGGHIRTEADLRRREAQVRQMEESARARESDARQREAEAKRREAEARLAQEEARKAAIEARHQQEELERRVLEEQIRRDEAEKEAKRARDEAERLAREAAGRQARERLDALKSLAPTAESLFRTPSAAVSPLAADDGHSFQRTRMETQRVTVTPPGRNARARVVDVVKVRRATIGQPVSLPPPAPGVAPQPGPRTILTLSGPRLADESPAPETHARQEGVHAHAPCGMPGPAALEGPPAAEAEAGQPASLASRFMEQLRTDPLVVNAAKVAAMLRHPDGGKRTRELITEMRRTLSGLELSLAVANAPPASD